MKFRHLHRSTAGTCPRFEVCLSRHLVLQRLGILVWKVKMFSVNMAFRRSRIHRIRGVYPPKPMMHIAYSPNFREIYSSLLFSFFFVFWLPLLWPMMHLRIMLNTYWTPQHRIDRQMAIQTTYCGSWSLLQPCMEVKPFFKNWSLYILVTFISPNLFFR